MWFRALMRIITVLRRVPGFVPWHTVFDRYFVNIFTIRVHNYSIILLQYYPGEPSINNNHKVCLHVVLVLPTRKPDLNSVKYLRPRRDKSCTSEVVV